MLKLLGYSCAAYAGYRYYQEYYMAPLNFVDRYGKKSWVMITGASSGIGLEWANQFAMRGFNIVMISKNPEKLANTARRVSQNHGVVVKTILADFTEPNLEEHIDRIMAETQALDISVLINNVWKLETRSLADTPEDDIEKLLQMNILTPTLLTQAMIPKLKNRGKRAAIINMSSLAAKAPGPNAGIFSASKAYNLNFSVSLHDELRENVDVLAVLPGYLETPQTVGMRHQLNFHKPKDCLEGALKFLGRDAIAYGVREHSMQGFILNFLPYKTILKIRAQLQSQLTVQ